MLCRVGCFSCLLLATNLSFPLLSWSLFYQEPQFKTMSRLSHHANARGSGSTSRSQPLPSPSQTIQSGRDRSYYQRLGSQGSETQDYHVPLARSRPSSGQSFHSARAPRTPPAGMSYVDSANFSPTGRDYEPPDVHNLRTGTFSFGRPALRPLSGGIISSAHGGVSNTPQRPPRTAPDNPLAPVTNQGGQGRPPTPLEPQTTHIRAWLHRLETSVNVIRHEFEAFQATNEAEKDGRILMKDAMSSTLEACRQIPQVLQTQNGMSRLSARSTIANTFFMTWAEDEHAKSLASELKLLMAQYQGQADTSVSKKLRAFEQKLVDLDRRTSTSNALLSDRIEEVGTGSPLFDGTQVSNISCMSGTW